MNRFIALFLFSASLFAAAADAQCPEMDLMGPALSVSVGEKLKFTLRVSNVGNYPDLKYVWRATGGEIVLGQGTPSIEIRRDEFTTLTAYVEIVGLPEGCPNTASESVHIERPPSPTKVGKWKRGDIFARLQQFQADMAINPGDQGYIFIIRSDRSTPDSLNELRSAVLNFAPKDKNGDSPRVTFVEAEGPEELVEIWHVPPGSNNPECESCHSQKCPKITVRGPAGIWEIGDLLHFHAELDESNHKNLSYHWRVKGGALEKGQSTLTIKVRSPKSFEQIVTATLEVTGLPSNCPSIASETAGIAIEPTYTVLDEYSISARDINKPSLARLAKRLVEFPDDYGYIIEYFPPATPRATTERKIRQIQAYLRSQGQPENEYKIVVAEAERTYTKIYSIPPGVEHPQP